MTIKVMCRRICRDEALAEDVVLAERAKPVILRRAWAYHGIDRWLDQQIGRQWDEIYRELCAFLSRRTGGSREILTVIRRAVCMTPDSQKYRFGDIDVPNLIVIDGILRSPI